MTRKALGRGLSALLGESTPSGAPLPSALQQVSVNLIDPNPFQPRRVISEPQLRELADSIQASGVVQPVLLRKAGDRFQLVAGERRWRGAVLAELETVPALVRELSDREALEIALTENLMREDLSSIEVAHAYHAMQEKFNYSHEEIAKRLGIDRSTVTNTLRLLKLQPEVQQFLEQKQISPGHARALLSCPTPAIQLQLAQLIIHDGLSVRQAERMAATANPASTERPSKAGLGGTPQEAETDSQPRPDANIRHAVLELERTLGTRVKIVGDGNRGHIQIAYYSAQDLSRLYERLARE